MALMKDIVKLITSDGWQLIVLRGPHWQFVHSSKPGRVTISSQLCHELSRGAVRSIARQTQLALKEKKHDGALSGSR
jgi:predicted RNA binding protein YcfA (HicA-like mRNA interferase family)